MLDSGIDLVIAFRVGDSRGTTDAIARAERRGIPVRLCDVPDGRYDRVEMIELPTQMMLGASPASTGGEPS